jgi:hypothetical protein
VDVVGELRQIGPLRLVRQARDQRSIESDRGGHGVEIVCRAPVEVDPQELPVTDRVGKSGFQLDLAVLAVGVIEASLDPAVACAECGDQWRTASRMATRTATNAVAYWRTSIDRSTSWTGGSITPAWGIWDTV